MAQPVERKQTVRRMGNRRPLGRWWWVALAAGLSWAGWATGDEEHKRELPPIPRIEETVDLAAITQASEFTAFMERHSFPLPDVPLARFTARVAGRPIITAVYRLTDAAAVGRMYFDFQEQLGVNLNLDASPDNRWTVYKITPLANNRSGSGVLSYTNGQAGYALQYAFQGNYEQNLATVTVALKPSTP